MSVILYSTLYKEVVDDMSSIPPLVLVLRKIRDAAREFCDRSHAYHEDIVFDQVADLKTYILRSANGATVKQVFSAFRRSAADVLAERDGTQIALNKYKVLAGAEDDSGLWVECDSDDVESGYYLDSGETLNDYSVYLSPTETDVLFCGFDAGSSGVLMYLASAADYASALVGVVPANAFVLDPPSTDFAGSYTAQGTFTGAATVINSVDETFSFVFNDSYVPSTDVTEGLLVRCVMVPASDSISIPSDLLHVWRRAFVSGARASLMNMNKKPWSDQGVGTVERRRFIGMISNAKWDCVTQNKSVGLRGPGAVIF